MKNRFYRTSFKALAVVLSAVLAVSLAISAVAAILMLKMQIYTRPEEALRSEIYAYLLQERNSEAFYSYTIGEEFSLGGNYYYQIKDSGGNVVAGNYTGQPVSATEESKRYWEVYFPDETVPREGYYTVIGYVAEEKKGSDLFTLADKVFSFFYQMRYTIFLWMLLMLLGEVALWIYLFCGVANHPGEEKPRLNPVDQFPFDLATILFYLMGMVQYAVLQECGEALRLILLCVFGLVDYLLLIWYFLSMAARLKVGILFRSTLIGQCSRWMKRALSELPLIWKTVVYTGVLLAADLLLFISNIWEPDNLSVIWCIEKLILVALIFYVAVSIAKLKKGGERLAEGHLNERLDTSCLIGDLKEFGESLNSIGNGMNKAVEERIKSERFKTELITNVSHDIKTPLTSIVNYVDLIKKEDLQDEKLCQYVEVLDRQSARLKKLIEDLVEASKASTGNLSVRREVCDAGVLMTQIFGEYDERFRERGLEPILNLPEEPISVLADPRHFWRILDNLMVNILKYALSGTRVYLDLWKEEGKMVMRFRNISRAPLNIDGEELMERFVRGDASRNTEGSGLGLSIARSLAELQGGKLLIRVDGDLFKVTLHFPILTE